MKLTSFEKNVRIIIFNEDGTIDAIFASENSKKENNIKTYNLDNIECIKELLNFEKKLITKEKDENDIDRHLFYLKSFLKDNYQKEFAEKRINPTRVMDDTLLYYYLTRINKAILINSSNHINLLCTPREGVNELQAEKIEIIKNLFNYTFSWELVDDMRIERYKDNPRQGYLEIGNTKKGNIDYILNNLKIKNNNKIK